MVYYHGFSLFGGDGMEPIRLEDIDFNRKGQIVGLLTPELAEVLLGANFKNNRPLSKTKVSYLVGEMKRGKWIEANSIKFSSCGRLIDGQHRLTALIEYGEPVIFRIDTGMPFDSATVIDTGKKRSSRDIAHILGHSDIQRQHVSIFRGMHYYQTQNSHGLRKYSPSEVAEMTVRFKECIKFSLQHYSCKGGNMGATVLSVIASAWYTQNRELLERFLWVFQTCEVEDALDKSPVLLRRISDDFNSGGTKSASERLNMMHKTQTALKYYLSGEKPNGRILMPTKKMLFPVQELMEL